MESERPQRTTSSSNSNSSSSTSELFICFTSRLSSSSMKISSKSILSPGRAREPSQISLSSSLSRRLKNSGSIKGGQASPMFPTGGKKKGCAFDNPEPSSPKVTCIGQVRVKTKKQGKKMRTRSKRRSSEASFRKPEQNLQSMAGQQENQNNHHENNQQGGGFQLQNLQQQQDCLPHHHRNQRWVHLPLTICEALRAFGAEFNCFLPCRSSCMTSEKDKEEKEVRSAAESGSSCGAVFARWLVALQDGDGKGREIELVVGEEERTTERRSSSRRRQMFEGIEIKEETKESNMEDEEEGRVSICVPPKNALLLMRCRSDPVKMAALANRFWESPTAPKDEEDEDEDEYEDDEGGGRRDKEAEQDDEKGQVKAGLLETEQVAEQQANLVMEEEEGEEEEEEEVAEEEEDNPESTELDELQEEIGYYGEDPREESEGEVEQEGKEVEEEEEEQELEVNRQLAVEKESLFNVSLREIVVDADNYVLDEEENAAQLLEENGYEQDPPHEEEEEEKEMELEEERRASVSKSSSEPVQSVEQVPVEDDDNIHGGRGGGEEEEDKAESGIEAKVTEAAGSTVEEKETPEAVTHQISKPEYPNNTHEELEVAGSEPKAERESSSVLPDCLRLMMCEPKLSMEVSKETWVCSTDFVRWLPERKVNQKNGPDQPKKQLSIVNNKDSNSVQPSSKQLANQLMQPPRSSCSFPVPAAPASMATIVEEKLVGSKAYEPFVLTRCKSEPMRSSAKFTPDACFWKNRKLEPHRPATLGVGAAGVGF